ncbi:MAG: carboxypeptidase regulatory-like domain-containing protein [Planctomycetota bacterium]
MRRLLAVACAGALLASGAWAFLLSNSRVGAGYVNEYVPANRRPVNLLVDTEGVSGVTNPLVETQDLMNQWNSVTEAQDVFGTASAGGPYNGTTVGQTFGRFTDTQYEVAFDDTGDILNQFGVGTAVLGITLKSVDRNSGNILDILVVINTQPGFLVAPGTGATARDLFRGTLVHELGHVTGLGHTPVGMVNQTSFGIFPAPPQRMPTMYPFRIPQTPQEGQTIEADDVAGLATIYPDANAGLGSLSGTVRSASGAPISQIHVRAVGPVSGAQHQLGRLTRADGSFSIPNMPPGAYRVIVEAVNGRGGVDSDTLAGGTDAFGAMPYIYAQDEYWQPGDDYDPGADDPIVFAEVQVRAGRDTSGIAFVLNAAPLLDSQAVNGSLAAGDSQLPGFFYVDYFVFAGDAGDVMTLNANSSGFVPQLRLLRPSDGVLIAEDLPTSGNAQIGGLTLPETGIYTVALSSGVVTGNPGGTGTYSLGLQGTGDALPPPPQVVGPTMGLGPEQPGAQELGSPVCSTAVLQARISAPSHEQLLLDRVTLQGSGSGDEALDVVAVRLVHDLNRDGEAGFGEPTLAEGTYASDNGSLTLTGVDFALDAGENADLLVVYDVTVTSVSSAAGFSAWWFLPLLLPIWFLRRRRAAAVAMVAVLACLPLACGGSGADGPACNLPFNPDGAVVDFQLRVAAGDVDAFTTTSATPVNLLTVDLVSATLSVSN